MKHIALFLRLLPLISLLLPAQARQWTAEEATAWGKSQPRLVGSNFTPSTSINQH